MDKLCTAPIDSWEATRNGALKKIKNAAKDSGNALLKEIAKEEDPSARIERRKNAEVIHKIVSKCVSNYENGEYTFEQSIDMLCGALKKVK